MNSMTAFAAAVLAAAAASAISQAQPIRLQVVWKDASPGGWRWMEDYALGTAVYVVGCPNNRKCRVGTGVFFRNRPRGSQMDFSGDVEVTVFGVGAVYVRVLDGDKPVRVGFYRKSTSLIPIYPPPSLPKPP